MMHEHDVLARVGFPSCQARSLSIQLNLVPTVLCTFAHDTSFSATSSIEEQKIESNKAEKPESSYQIESMTDVTDPKIAEGAEAAVPSSDAGTEAPPPEAPAPKEVLYCQICTFPPEYCEFGSSVSKCRQWLESAHPDVYKKIWSEEAINANLAKMTTKQAEDLEKEAVKKERKAEAKAEKEKAQKASSRIVLTKSQRTKRKATTTVGGLNQFIPPLPAMKVVAKGYVETLELNAKLQVYLDVCSIYVSTDCHRDWLQAHQCQSQRRTQIWKTL